MVLVPLPDGRTAPHVRAALTRQLIRLPAELRRTLTWDQGKEMAEHVRFSVDTNIDVYFCDPHSPWQRGSNENTNGLLRQYFPKTADLSVYTRADLAAVATATEHPSQTDLSVGRSLPKYSVLLLRRLVETARLKPDILDVQGRWTSGASGHTRQ